MAECVCKTCQVLFPEGTGYYKDRYCSKKCQASIAYNCLQCDGTFTHVPSQPRKFCSVRCFGLYERERVERVCERCGQSYETVASQNLYYCSVTCQKPPRPDAVCKHCGRTFKGDSYNPNVYCSKACQTEAGRAYLICRQCGVEFQTSITKAKNGRVYCGKDCQKAAEDAKLIDIACLQCGTVVRKSKSYVEQHQHQFCGKACADQWQGRWTDEEDAILRQHYPTTEARDLLALLPHRSVQTILSRASKLGIIKIPGWTEEEDALLRERYATTKIAELLRLFPSRSHSAIKVRAQILGVKKSPSARRFNAYTEEEASAFPEAWRLLPASELLRLFPGRTMQNMRNRAAWLGLPRRRKKNPDANAHAKRMHIMRKRNAEGSYTSSEWLAMCEWFGNRCLCCGKDGKLTVDHVVPLVLNGSNWIWNLQPLCASCNSRKEARHIDYRDKEKLDAFLQSLSVELPIS